MEYQLTFEDERNDLEYRLKNIDDNRTPISILLDTVEDVKNIGAIYRLADAARLKHIYFYNSKFDINHKKIKSVSRSTNKYTKSSVIESYEEVQQLLLNKTLITLERTSESIPYNSIPQPIITGDKNEIIIAAGAENFGVSDQLIALSDTVTHIPMFGINTSMNVASALSIVAYHLLFAIKRG